jgi:hypothetical protein
MVFVGPSLAGRLEDVRRLDPELVIAGPAVWGDVAKAVIKGAKIIGIIDGCFEQTRAVWHKEILYALSQGVTVAGAASMGALRAAECAVFGMIGIGRIFEQYAGGDLSDDSDVALVHAPAELGYLPLSEPRVNVMATLSAMRGADLLSPLEYQTARAAAQRLHYSELSHLAVINAAGIASLRRVQRLTAWANRHRVDQKQQDALALMDWIRTCPETAGEKPRWTFSESSQWRALMQELRA